MKLKAIAAGTAGLALAAVVLSGTASSALNRHQDKKAPSTAGAELLWSDEFDGPAGTRVNSKTWNSEVGNRDQEGWWNNELQYYTSSADNAALDGSGNLVITAKRAAKNSKLPCYLKTYCDYTSARLTTENKKSFKYGRIEVRAKLPTGQGLLPAIWLLGNNGQEWPAQGEIDIAEVVGHEPRTVYGTAHGPTYFNGEGIGESTGLSRSADQDFHVYSITKTPGKITWAVDGKTYYTLTPAQLPSTQDWVFDQDMHLLLNVAVGGDWPGDPSSATRFPAKMTVDYVRYYKN